MQQCIPGIWETGIPLWVPKFWSPNNFLTLFISFSKEQNCIVYYSFRFFFASLQLYNDLNVSFWVLITASSYTTRYVTTK